MNDFSDVAIETFCFWCQPQMDKHILYDPQPGCILGKHENYIPLSMYKLDHADYIFKPYISTE